MKILKQYIRKADIILFLILVVTGIAVSAVLAVSQAGASAGDKVIIESGAKLYATYSLSEDRTIIVPAPRQNRTDSPAAESERGMSGDAEYSSDHSSSYDYYNVVQISSGKVRVSEASCKNQVCVHHSAISRSGESIVCLPNRLAVRIESDNLSGTGSGSGAGSDTDDSGSEKGEGYDTITS
jgi:hypothetical protein